MTQWLHRGSVDARHPVGRRRTQAPQIGDVALPRGVEEVATREAAVSSTNAVEHWGRMDQQPTSWWFMRLISS